MNVNQAISTFRLRLGAAGWDDDNQLSDEAIFKLLSDAMSVVFTRYKEKFYKISDWFWSTFGVKLQMVNADFFPCIDIAHCSILESVHEIPEPLMGRNRAMLKVYNGNTELPEYTHGSQYDEYLNSMPSWNIVNGKLRIYNNKTLKAITVKTIPYNFMSWFDKRYCEDTDTVECYDLDSMTWPLMADSKMQSVAYDIALQSLGLTLNQIQQEPNQNPAH